eukprot:scaffold417470_cov24-Attheya_sp.AAC.1
MQLSLVYEGMPGNDRWMYENKVRTNLLFASFAPYRRMAESGCKRIKPWSSWFMSHCGGAGLG